MRCPFRVQEFPLGTHKAWCNIAGWQLKLGTQITSGNSLARQQSRSRGQVYADPKDKGSKWKRTQGTRGVPQPQQWKAQPQRNAQGDTVRTICTGCFVAASGREEARADLEQYLALRERASGLEYQVSRGKSHPMPTIKWSSPEHYKHLHQKKGSWNFNHKTRKKNSIHQLTSGHKFWCRNKNHVEKPGQHVSAQDRPFIWNGFQGKQPGRSHSQRI